MSTYFYDGGVDDGKFEGRFEEWVKTWTFTHPSSRPAEIYVRPTDLHPVHMSLAICVSMLVGCWSSVGNPKLKSELGICHHSLSFRASNKPTNWASCSLFRPFTSISFIAHQSVKLHERVDSYLQINESRITRPVVQYRGTLNFFLLAQWSNVNYGPATQSVDVILKSFKSNPKPHDIQLGPDIQNRANVDWRVFNTLFMGTLSLVPFFSPLAPSLSVKLRDWSSDTASRASLVTKHSPQWHFLVFRISQTHRNAVIHGLSSSHSTLSGAEEPWHRSMELYSFQFRWVGGFG